MARADLPANLRLQLEQIKNRSKTVALAERLLDNHMRLPVAVEHTQPPLTPEDAYAATPFCLGVVLDAADQWQPARHVLAFAGRDDADLAGIGQLEPGRRDGIDRGA